MLHSPFLLTAIALGTLCAGALGCSKNSQGPGSPADPKFDAKWSALAKAGAEVMYIEDDRGEGLMGNVRRASHVKAEAALPGHASASGLPEQPAGEDVQRVIRSNLPLVKSCYLVMARSGVQRSGKAIVSFAIGADGRPAEVSVDAP